MELKFLDFAGLNDQPTQVGLESKSKFYHSPHELLYARHDADAFELQHCRIELRMIFRKEPLIDAEWLLGPTDRKPTPLFRMDIGFGVLLTSAILVGGWTVLSDRVTSMQKGDVEINRLSQNSLEPRGQVANATLASEQITSQVIDHSLIRTVDRFVPGQHSAELKSIDQFANNTSKNQVSGDLAEIRSPIKLPEPKAGLAQADTIRVKDLRMDSMPMLPIDLLSDATLDGQHAAVASPTPDWFSTNSLGTSNSSQGNALQRPPQLTKVVRTVAYSGKLANVSAKSATNNDPPPLVTNGLRSPRLTSIDASQSTPENDEDALALAGLEKRPTGDVVRLLSSVQPRIAGAALNELKRRKFTDAHIELAIELTNGSREERIASLNRLATEQTIAPLPWLVWMAEDEDRNIREHAIRMLASIPDEDARRQMRLLMNREKDLALSNLLRQACLSSGAVHAMNERR